MFTLLAPGGGGHFIHPISLTLLYAFCQVFSYFYTPFVLNFSSLQGIGTAWAWIWLCVTGSLSVTPWSLLASLPPWTSPLLTQSSQPSHPSLPAPAYARSSQKELCQLSLLFHFQQPRFSTAVTSNRAACWRWDFTQTGEQGGWRGEHTEQLHPRTWKSMIVIGDSLPQTTPSAVYAWRDKLALCLFNTFTVTVIFSLTQDAASENDIIFAKWVHGQGPNNLGVFPHLIITDIFSIIYHFNSALNMQQRCQTLIQVRQKVQILLQLSFFCFGFIHTLNLRKA